MSDADVATKLRRGVASMERRRASLGLDSPAADVVPRVGDYIDDGIIHEMWGASFGSFPITEVDAGRARCYYAEFTGSPVSVCVRFDALRLVGTLALSNNSRPARIWRIVESAQDAVPGSHN